jgi:hypothetical protein
MNTWQTLLLFVLFAAFAVVAYRILSAPKRYLRNYLGVDELAALEEGLKGLEKVIVVCDRVEAPSDGLRRAVTQNLQRGVAYLFLVSNRRAEAELDGYFNIFRLIARDVTSRNRAHDTIDRLVGIQSLPYDWDQVPYIFYQTFVGDQSRTFALRGDQEKEGISDGYFLVTPRSAEAIATTLLHGAPKPIQAAIGEGFTDFKPLTAKVVAPDFRRATGLQ